MPEQHLSQGVPLPSMSMRRRTTSLRMAAALSVLLAAAGCSDPTEPQDPPRVTKPPVGAPSTSPSPSPQSGGPASGSTGGPSPESLAKAFPKDLIPLMDDARILVSDVETADKTVSISLVASTDASPRKVLDFYDKVLTNHKFQPLESNSIEGAASRTYERGQGAETINISVVESGSNATITIGAHLSTKSVDNA